MSCFEKEMKEEGKFFCVKCGSQLSTIDEIQQGVCHNCEYAMLEIAKHGDFYCWACGKHLESMGELAQGVCRTCKSKIIKTLKSQK